MALVLEFCELVGEQTRVVIVNQLHRPNDGSVGGYHGRLDQSIANQVAERLRAVLISFAGDERVKTPQSFRVDRYSDTGEGSHRKEILPQYRRSA